MESATRLMVELMQFVIAFSFLTILALAFFMGIYCLIRECWGLEITMLWERFKRWKRSGK